MWLATMKEFDYSLDYKNMMFDPNDKRYRINRWNKVLLVRPYTDDICKYLIDLKHQKMQLYHQQEYYSCIIVTKIKKILLVWICVKIFRDVILPEPRRYANHKDIRNTKIYKVLPQEKDALTSPKNQFQLSYL